MTDLECQTLLLTAQSRLQAGDEAGARQIWGNILAMRPQEAGALDGMGQSLFRQQRWADAKALFSRLSQSRPNVPIHWVQLALCCEQLGQTDEHEQHLARALQADPYDLLALLLRGELMEKLGRKPEAQRAYGAAATVAPSLESIHPQLRPALLKANTFLNLYRQELSNYMAEKLTLAREACRGEDLRRFDLSLDIFLGHKRRYESQPMRHFFPHLKPREFFERHEFPCLEALEAETERIRDEFLAVVRDLTDWEPYIQYSADQPLAQWKELNHSPRWSAFHLWKDGVPVADHLQRCPQTAAALDAVPRPEQPGRTPVALFSLLRPATRIPPHVGAANVRVLGHLPLVVPPGCGFRVGNTVREWREGEAWVFDDTIEHEAWNNSDRLRVILIWDMWHPDLSPAEKRMLTEMSRALNAFSGPDPEFAS